MPEPPDLVKAWRDATQQVRGFAGTVAGQAGHVPDLLGPLQRQADVIEQFLRRQLELEQDLIRRTLAPAQATAEALDKAPDAMRAQAAAFRAVAVSFGQAADVLELQATAVEQAIAALKTPVQVAQRGLGRVARPPEPPTD